MIVDYPPEARCTNHVLERLEDRCFVARKLNKKDIINSYLCKLKFDEIFFIPDYQADYNGKDSNFKKKLFGICSLFGAKVVLVVGILRDGAHLIVTLYPYDKSAAFDFAELYEKHKKVYKGEIKYSKIPIEPQVFGRKDRPHNPLIVSKFYGKKIS